MHVSNKVHVEPRTPTIINQSKVQTIQVEENIGIL